MADETKLQGLSGTATEAPHAAVPDGETRASDNPEAYIPRDRRWALSRGVQMPDRVTGSGLFADISGFTPLTEALANELGPQRGAEELTANIGRVFHAVIGELDAFGGDVIYFSGDAITCWIDGDDGTRAAAAAIAMQEAMARTGEITTPGGTRVQLAMKVAIAVGDARRFLVGDPELQLIDVLAGRLIDDLAAAEHHAGKGEIVLEPSAIASLGERVALGELRTDEETSRTYAVLTTLHATLARTPVQEPPPLAEELVRPWLLPAVYERLRTGRGEFLAELRPAYPVFLRFAGIDYDHDDAAIAKLDAFVRGAQRVMSSYGGNVLQLTLGDKGAYLYGVFGSPLAHEDDAARAAGAALELRDLEKSTAAREIQVGITYGQLRSGTYGHEMRRTFVCLGDAVNLSARLMSAASAGEILVSDVVHDAAGDAFMWRRLPDMRVKGKSEPIAVYSLGGSLERASRRKIRFELPLVGRRDELSALLAALGDAAAGSGRVLAISAEAGMGKSRLVAEFVRTARRGGRLVVFGECQAFGTNTAYFPWREIWRRLFGLEDEDPYEVQIARLADELAAIDPALVPRAPLLDTVVGLPIPDTELTRSFDPQLRKGSLEDLLIQCLRGRSAREPLVIVVEDCHWIDELSRDLLGALARTCAHLPVLFVLAYRPAAAPGGDLGLERLPFFGELTLDQLPADDARSVVRAKLQQIQGDEAAPSDELAELVAARAGGNPLYIEELVSYVANQGIDTHDHAAMQSLKLPESLHSLVLSRIDTISEEPRRTLKVASVIGRVFRAPMLPGAYPELGALDDVRAQLDILRGADLVGLDREAELAYLFKHVVTQEVAYGSMPFGLRSGLHRRVGIYIEGQGPDEVARNLNLLAHHFWLGDDEAKKREYLARAAAASQASYANEAAISYFERLLTLLDGAERVDASIRLAEVLQVIGEIPRAEQLVAEARQAAEELGDTGLLARCDHSLGESARRLGRFDEADRYLERARESFESAGDAAGVALALQVLGTVRAQRADFATARQRYQQSLAIREELGDRAGVAAVSNNLGIVAQHLGDMQLAREYGERALALYSQIGDRRRLSSCEINLAWMDGMAGDTEGALRHGEEAVRLAMEVGDRLNLAIAQNNMGDAFRDSGRLAEAGVAYASALETYLALGDQWPLMALLEDIAVLSSVGGDAATAMTLVGAADALRAELESPRAEAAEADLLERLSPSRGVLGDHGADAARASGAELAPDAATEVALRAARAINETSGT